MNNPSHIVKRNPINLARKKRCGLAVCQLGPLAVGSSDLSQATTISIDKFVSFNHCWIKL